MIYQACFATFLTIGTLKIAKVVSAQKQRIHFLDANFHHFSLDAGDLTPRDIASKAHTGCLRPTYTANSGMPSYSAAMPTLSTET